jgi:hypothetical protein
MEPSGDAEVTKIKDGTGSFDAIGTGSPLRKPDCRMPRGAARAPIRTAPNEIASNQIKIW